ncbi:MAG: leucine-rich repeat domain-containing protein [Lactobacillales bacterium]|jgi:hypothetical protein|nr:leucine-rich repeat domain-containing protein [Lactobacillales bacterium]
MFKKKLLILLSIFGLCLFVHFSVEAIPEYQITLAGSRLCLKRSYTPDSEKVTTINVEEGVELIDEEAFCDYKNVKTIVFPKSLKEIRKYAFRDCHKLEKVVFPPNCELRQIGARAFYMSSRLRSIKLPKNVQFIGEYAFGYCNNLHKVSFLPESNLLKISQHAFAGTNLTEVTLPETIQFISLTAFKNCKRLQRVDFFPDHLPKKEIDSKIFVDVPNLNETIVIPVNTKIIRQDIFGYIEKLA